MRFKDAISSKLVLLIFDFGLSQWTATARYSCDTLAAAAILNSTLPFAWPRTNTSTDTHTWMLIQTRIRAHKQQQAKSWTKIKSNHDMIYDFLFEECVKCWWFFALSLDFDIWKCRPLNFSPTHDSWCERGILHPWISAFRSKGAAAAMTIRTPSFRCFESIIIELINHDHFSRIQPAKFVLIDNPRNCMRSMIFSPSLSLSFS